MVFVQGPRILDIVPPEGGRYMWYAERSEATRYSTPEGARCSRSTYHGPQPIVPPKGVRHFVLT